MSTLPVPDAELAEHSRQLLNRLREAAVNDRLSFADFMHRALYEPGLGYYASGLQKFGEGGDFVTAPELSPLFAACVANQARQVLDQFEGASVLEFGAGTGTMAAEVLGALNNSGALPSRYCILEVSANLRDTQYQTIKKHVPELLKSVEWLESWPTSFSGFVFGNEVLDAMPVERFCWRNDAVEQCFVDFNSEEPVENYVIADVSLGEAVEHLRKDCGAVWPDGYISETNVLLQPWFDGFTDSLQAGALLLLDYGYPRREYYHPSRSNGTLRCYYRHRAHDNPYYYPGLQDITAHVDFTAVVEAATNAGLALEGFTNQRQYLLNCRLAELAEAQMVDVDDATRFLISQQVQKLTLPAHMGESFNAIGFSKNLPHAMVGFAQGDQSNRL